jgi:hypothetical protein
MTQRDKPWQIAADLETAAKAFRVASEKLVAIDISALGDIDAVIGDRNAQYCQALLVSRALQALSDRYQDIADAEVG